MTILPLGSHETPLDLRDNYCLRHGIDAADAVIAGVC